MLLFVAVLVVLILTVEAGFRMGRRRRLDGHEIVREQLKEARDGSVLLLSLLLGFTLAMALTRYDERKHLMVQEANDIGTAALRAHLLPEPYSSRVGQLLTGYVDARLAYFRSGKPMRDMQAKLAETREFQNELWRITEAAARAAPTPMTAGYIESLNSAFDISENQIATLENRIPQSVWLMILVIAMLACLASGLVARRRVLFSILLTPLMAAVVMSLIADLDSPESGHIRVDTRSLERLSVSMHASLAKPLAAELNPGSEKQHGGTSLR